MLDIIALCNALKAAHAVAPQLLSFKGAEVGILGLKEFGLALNVTDHNPPIDPRLPRFDRVRDSLGKAMPF